MTTTKPYDWETHTRLEENRLAARSYFVPYAEKTAALSFERGNSQFFKLLNGVWKFCYSPSPAEAPENFYEDAYDVEPWDDVRSMSGSTEQRSDIARAVDCHQNSTYLTTCAPQAIPSRFACTSGQMAAILKTRINGGSAVFSATCTCCPDRKYTSLTSQ